jgi:alpha-ketoglutarate-dependent taurine dioxygenase
MKELFPLTASGIGLMASSADDPGFFRRENIEALLERHHFIAFKALNWSIGRLHEFMSGLGELVHNEKRQEGTMLTLNGQYSAKEVLRGKGRMPLHRDGLLMNEDVKYVGIYCQDMEDLQGGRTYISDSAAAFDKFPDEIRQVLVSQGIRIFPYDTDYYLKNEPKWYYFGGTIQKHGRLLPNGGLPFHMDEKPSWGIQIAGLEAPESDACFETIEAILEDEQYTYYHSWSKGDLLLFDNYYVMHGREAYTGERDLIQMQVKQ